MSIQHLLRYWRHCLADGELSAPRWQRNPETQSITLDGLLTGWIDPSLAAKIVNAVEERLNRQRSRSKYKGQRDDGDPVMIDRADVAMTPFLLRRKVEHSQSQFQDQQSYAPFWIAARLSRDGSLSPHPERSAWFVRDHLDPTGGNDPVVGPLDAMDAFLARSPDPALDDGDDPSTQWSGLIAWVETFFEAVTGGSPLRFQLEELAVVDEVLLLPHSAQTGASRHLLGLYDALLPTLGETAEAAEAPPRLLSALAGQTEATVADPEAPLDDPARRRHLGHMSDRFALGPSQRESLHALLRLADGEMMALNGPPGTGKTTWIQSAVASLWVERALARGEPPIVVATSANNRAVTNILDTFQKASSPSASGPGERWLPTIDTYGLFLPSGSQSKTTSYRWATHGAPEWSGLPASIENQAYVEENRAYYREQAAKHYSKTFVDVKAVVEHLHADLRATADQMYAIQDAGQHLRSLRDSMPDPSPEIARRRLNKARVVAEAEAENIEGLARDIDEIVETVPLLEELLAFLPPIRQRRNHRFVRLFQRHDLLAPALMGWSYRQDLEAAIEEHRWAAAARLVEIEASRQAVETWEGHELAWVAHLKALVENPAATGVEDAIAAIEYAMADPHAVELLIDQILRRQLFLLAGRYWEGRWLLELRALLGHSDARKLHRQSQADCLRRFRRFAKVTPLFVSTAYMLPKFFDYFDSDPRPLIEGIDLLIVEEAGQVAPELGGVLFALAKRAVVLGDVFQIEPVWNVGHAIDDANRERHDVESFREEVFHSSRGSVMGAAQTRTRFTASGRSDGLWLREHRRCVPDVIAYCQDLVPAYRQVLEPHRPEVSTRVLPALGWAHVRSDSQQVGGSWCNVAQAEVIARWLADHRTSLEGHYNLPIHKIVGIVTPYRSQVSEIRQALATFDIDSKLEVGTVHTFQGGELPVMLFSPVVTRDQQGVQFFDRGINMLNVAVSRAQDSFLVFGDMKMFDPASSKPSGILARHLFAEESNELTDVDSAPELLRLPGSERIAGLENHRRVLREAFEQARQRLLIVSPYLTRRAVDADRLIEQIATTQAQVSIAYSIDMAKPEAHEVAEQLAEAGAEIIRLLGFHTKTLAVDDLWFTEGSFNWLSAVRQEGAKFQYREASTRCGPPTALTAISEIWEAIDAGRQSRPL